MVVFMKTALMNFYSREMFVNNERATIDTNEKRVSANKQQTVLYVCEKLEFMVLQ